MLNARANARVSVVIPVHNGAEFIADAVRSALSQTYAPFECVVVDDGSTDGTADVLDRFGGAISVLRQPCSGVAAARNAGIRASTGDAIALLDADDVWLPHKLARQVEALAARPQHGAVCTGYVMSDRSLAPRRVVSPPDGPVSVRSAVLLEGPGVGFSFTGVVTREAIEDVGVFDERLSTSSDLEFVWRLARRVGLVGISEPLSLYRQHGTQMHRDLDRLEHDVELLLGGAGAAELGAAGVDRARANLQTYLGFRCLLGGDLLPALAHLRAASRIDARRVVLHPASALARRLHQDLAGRRWHARMDLAAAVTPVADATMAA